MKNDLKAVHQYKGETLRQYIQRLSQMRNKILRISNEEVISAFSTGVAVGTPAYHPGFPLCIQFMIRGRPS
jgi:hypothetical protein